ncbi:MAG: TPM domain-containing protein [Nitrospira sp.]|nr:TPM domain-containing protein [Nitrospira sp.]
MPSPMGYVSDHAGVLAPDWKERIRSVCQDLERKTGVEMVVVTVPSAKPYASAQEYAAALYQKWGIGSAQKEHGVLVLAVIDSRKATVTLGKSMVPVITPAIVEEVSSQYLERAFGNAKFEEGLYRAAVAIASASQDVKAAEPSKHKLKGFGVFLTATMSFGALWFLWWISRPDLRHPYGRVRRGEYWGSGRGGFTGNFGGFGGGMSGEGLR